MLRIHMNNYGSYDLNIVSIAEKFMILISPPQCLKCFDPFEGYTITWYTGSSSCCLVLKFVTIVQ